MKNSEKHFIDNIFSFARTKLRFSLLGSIIYFITILLIMWLSLVLADQVFYFSEITRWGLLLINIVLILALIARILSKPFREWFYFNKRTDLTSAAEELPYYFPEGQDGFVITYQLINEKTSPPQTDNSLAQAAIDKFITGYNNSVFRSKLKWKDWIPSQKLAIVVWASALLLGSTHSYELYHSTKRLLNPANQYLEVPAFRFEVIPGDVQIIKGEPLTVRVQFYGPPIASLNLIQELNGIVQQQKLNKSEDFFFVSLKDLQNKFKYWISAIPKDNKALGEYLRSDTYQVDVLVPPRVEQLDLEIEPPAYTKLKSLQIDRNIGDVLAYPGSKVHVQALVNKPVEKAQFAFASSSIQGLQIRGSHLGGSFQVRKADSYKVILEDTTGLQNQNPIVYHISLLQDTPPFVVITEPGSDTESPLDGTLPLEIEAEDDFAISRLEVFYRIQSNSPGGDTSWTKKTLNVPAKNLVQTNYSLDFNRLPLTFGDTLKYFTRAWDNNGFSGSAISDSRQYLVLFPSLDELFAELDQEQQEEVDALDEVRKESENLRKELEKIERQMNQNSKLDWDKKQSLKKIVESQKEMQKKIQEMRQELEEAVQKLEKNNLLSPEIMEKYNQLQDMFQEVLSPELLQSLQNLQQAMDENRPQDLRQALKKFKLNQEAFEKNIERTMELLKRVQFEQKMDRLVQKAENLTEQQGKISEELESQQEQSIEDQTKKMQEQQKKQMKNLSRDTEEFMREELLEQFPRTEELVDSVHSELQDSALKKQLEQIQQQMSGQQIQPAQQNSEDLQQSFEQMQQKLQQAQQNMQQQSKNQIARKMQRISRNLLDLSFRQEQIQNQTRNMSPLDNNFNQNLKDQGQVLNNFDKVLQQISDLSKETFFLPPKMSSYLRASRSKMQQSIAQLSERDQGNAIRSQSEAMRALNQIVMQMSQAMSQMMQAKSGTGFEEFMRKMQQMACKQGQLNQQSLQLMQGQGNPGMLSKQEQAKMRRIGQGQSALRQALDEMAQDMGQRDDVLGELGQIAKDMELVEKDLLKAQPDRRTIDRQRRILSRMLDSQRSLEQREFSKKRKSKSGRQYVTRDPGDQGSGLLEDKRVIEEALRKARKQGYSREYQKLIELYFEKLLRSQSTEKQ